MKAILAYVVLTISQAVAILVLGFSNLIWIPISTCFGRRPALIFSTLICTVSSIWRVRSTSYKSFLGASA